MDSRSCQLNHGTTSASFDLSPAEQNFVRRNARHDTDYAIMRLVNWLVTDVCGIPVLEGVAPGHAGRVRRPMCGLGKTEFALPSHLGGAHAPAGCIALPRPHRVAPNSNWVFRGYSPGRHIIHGAGPARRPRGRRWRNPQGGRRQDAHWLCLKLRWCCAGGLVVGGPLYDYRAGRRALTCTVLAEGSQHACPS